MTNQPIRKRSTFGDIDPVAPPQRQAESTTARRSEDRQRSGSKTKVGFFLPAEEADRARAALVNTYGADREGPRTFSELIRRALRVEVERLEHTYNGGRPWPPIKPGEGVPQGRPGGQSHG